MRFPESDMGTMPHSTSVKRKTSDTPLLTATSLAITSLIPVAAHQLGLLHHLPDPPGNIFSSDEITESRTAHPFGIPDSLLGIASYGLTLSLVIVARNQPRTRKLLAIKLLADSTLATFNMFRQIVIFRRICSWCTGTVLCTAAMFVAGRGLIRIEMQKAIRYGETKN